MVRALANYLAGRDFPLLGTQPTWMAPGMKLLASAVNRMPNYLKEQVYIWGGWSEAIASGHFAAHVQRCMDCACTRGFQSSRCHPMLLWWCWCTAQACLVATCS